MADTGRSTKRSERLAESRQLAAPQGAKGDSRLPSSPARMKSPNEVAGYLAVSIPSLYRYLRSGRIRGNKVGGQWRISDDAVRRFLEDQIRVPKPRNE